LPFVWGPRPLLLLPLRVPLLLLLVPFPLMWRAGGRSARSGAAPVLAPTNASRSMGPPPGGASGGREGGRSPNIDGWCAAARFIASKSRLC
jgi:hypothetical protein